ncbi:MAG TPA: hypothetical protein VG937_37065 [Polyangiaceae bacterium]|nr:hypothetical protein [Polyangiaceae bacterium]
MAYKSCVLDGLYAIRWGREPELADVQRYANEISVACKAQGRPPVGLFIMPQDSQIPSDAFRKEQAAHLPKILENLEFAVAVFEGGGFKQALMRSALGAILLLAPKRYSIHVRSTVEEALIQNPPKPLRFDTKLAIAELNRRQILAV